MQQIGVDLDVVKKDQLNVRVQIKKLEDRLKVIDDGIKSLQEELADIEDKRGKTYDTLHELKKSREDLVRNLSHTYFQCIHIDLR